LFEKKEKLLVKAREEMREYKKQLKPFAMPPYWKSHLQGSTKPKKYICDDNMRQKLQQLLRDTSIKDSNSNNPTKNATVTKVERVEYPASWASYCGMVEQTRKRHGKLLATDGNVLKMDKGEKPVTYRVTKDKGGKKPFSTSTTVDLRNGYDRTKVSKSYKGAGICPYAIDKKGNVNILLGRLNYGIMEPFADFGGLRDRGEHSTKRTAAREFTEETQEIFSHNMKQTEEMLGKEEKNKVVRVYNEDANYVMYMMQVEFKDYPTMYKSVLETPSNLKHKIELSEMKWFSLKEIRDAINIAKEKGNSKDVKVRNDKNTIILRKELVDTFVIASKEAILKKIMNKNYKNIPYKKISGSIKYPLFQLDTRINEYYLWHGTNADVADIITRTGIQTEKLADKDSLYGKGMYFAENASKSDQYAVKRHGAGNGVLLLCRVALGKIFYTPDNLLGLKLPGRGCASKYVNLKSTKGSKSKLGSEWFDSIIADRNTQRINAPNGKQHHREFIIFDAQRCYPEFIVWYKH
jgi:hypothetical protein